MTENLDVETMRKKAEAAHIEGQQWFAEVNDEVLSIDEATTLVTVVAQVNPMAEWNAETAAAWVEHVVAFAPSAALALLDQLAAARSLADAQTKAVDSLRAEAISLRNEVAVLNGRLVAKGHGHD